MLYFTNEQVSPCQETKPCAECRERKGTWMTKLLTGDEVAVCGYCLLYSGKTEWGHDNREELLHAGRAAQELAAKHRKPLPMLDDRGRLLPPDAERFVMGVSFTSRMVVDRFGVGRDLSD